MSTRAYNWRKTLTRLNGAYSEATIKSYTNDVNSFVEWCARNNRRPFPATPKTLAAFVEERAEKYRSSSIKRNLSAIGKIHRMLRLKDPARDEEVLIACRRAWRKNRIRPRQAFGLTRENIDQMINACPNDLAGLRNRAMISTGFDTLCRRAELIALMIDDIEALNTGTGQIIVRRSKNDPYGGGRTAFLSARSLQFIADWRRASGIESGYLFRRIRHGHIGSLPLDPSSVTRVLKFVATSAELPVEAIQQISSHSLRVGSAQNLMKSGLGVLPIMRAGGWKTINVVARYVENTEIQMLLGDLPQTSVGPPS